MKRVVYLLPLLLCILLTGCICQHEAWTDANCEAPKTCQKCGETEGTPLGHVWSAATLNAPKTCTVCGQVEGEPLNILEIYPTDMPRYSETKFLFTAEEFSALLNQELESAGYSVTLEKDDNGEAFYEFEQEGTVDTQISCHISFDGELTNGETMYLFVYMDMDEATSQERVEQYHEIMGAVFRCVHIPEEGITYDDLIQVAETSTGWDGVDSYVGTIDHVGFTITNRDDMLSFMIILAA